LQAELHSTQDRLADARSAREQADARIAELEEELTNAKAEIGSRETDSPADFVTRLQRLLYDLNRLDNWPADVPPAKQKRLHKALGEVLMALRDAFAPKEPMRRGKAVKATEP
jgi:hypothetical protein